MRLDYRSRHALTVLATCFLATAPAQAQSPSGFGQIFTAPTGPNTTLELLAVGADGLSGVTEGSPFMARIFELSGTSLTGSSLFTQVLGRQFAGFTLVPRIELAPGATYMVVVFSEPRVSSPLFAYFPTNSHTDASFATCRGTTCGPFAAGRGSDLAGFEVRYGPTSVVPEPATWALLGTGLLVLGGATRARRRAARGA